MQESCPRKHHRQFAGLFCTVAEAAVTCRVPDVVSAKEPHNLIPVLPPNPLKSQRSFNGFKLEIDLQQLVRLYGPSTPSTIAYLKAKMISLCVRWTSSSTKRTASVWISSNGRNRLFKLFFCCLIICGREKIRFN